MELRILKRRLEVRDDTGQPVVLTRPQVRQLVCVLAMEADRLVAAERLTDYLWDRADAGDLARALKQAVYNARHALPPERLITEPGGYRLRVDATDYFDLADFRRLTELARSTCDIDASAAIVHYQAALDLWDEPPLGDLPETVATVPMRQSLLVQRRELREELAEAHLVVGHHRQVTTRLRLWLADDPLNEGLRGLLMLALYRSDRKGEALQEYANAKAELGASAAPGPRLQHLAAQLARNDPALGVPKRSATWTSQPEPEPPIPEIDTTIPSPARIYDYYLGGKDNYQADRAAAEEIMKSVPESPRSARANRVFLTRVVTLMAEEAGIRQFIDVGAGLPTQGNVHEIAQGITPDAHVVYVDNDPVVLAHGRALLETNPNVAVIEGDLRRPDAILADARLRQLIDFGAPIGLLLVGVLHFISPDDDPHRHVSRLVSVLPPGSHMAVSHGYEGDMNATSYEAALRVYRRSTTAIHSRDREEVGRFFRDLELLEPGIVWVSEWRPAPGSALPNSGRVHFVGGVGRKPAG